MKTDERPLFLTGNLALGSLEVANSRGYENTYDMAMGMVETWNQVVSPHDTVVCLGGHGIDPYRVSEFAKQVHGTVIWVYGAMHLPNGDEHTWAREFERHCIYKSDVFISHSYKIVGCQYTLAEYPFRKLGYHHVHCCDTITDNERHTNVSWDKWGGLANLDAVLDIAKVMQQT